MSVQIGNKEQIAQWTVLDTNARNNRPKISDVIDGIEWVITFRNILSPGIDDYKLEIMSQVEGQKVYVEIRLFGNTDLPDEVWSKDSIQVLQQRDEENILTSYAVGFYVKKLLSLRWPGTCLCHFFLYKKTEILPPVSQ